MKQGIRAVIMLGISCAIMVNLQIRQNRLPELEDISTFGASNYATTCQLQEFKVAPNDKQWTLDAIRYYTADGKLEKETIYQLDEYGRSYYLIPDGNRFYCANIMSNEELQKSILNDLSDCDITEQQRDEYGRLTFRQGVDPLSPEITYSAYWSYSPGQAESDLADALCSSVEIHHGVAPDEEHALYLDGDLNRVTEFSSYDIRNYDRFGNEVQLWISEECYLQTDSNGYLQLIVMKWYSGYEVIRTDASGKPLWSAVYSREDLTLQHYTVWEYRTV